jgi:hypothetical protein
MLLPEVGVSSNQDKKVFFVDVNQDLADGQLLDPSLDHFLVFLL